MNAILLAYYVAWCDECAWESEEFDDRAEAARACEEHNNSREHGDAS